MKKNNGNQKILKKPNIHLLSYGGTIACVSNKSTDEFYNKPNLDIKNLISSILDIAQKANIHYEQIAQILSQEMTEQDLLNLAMKIDQILKKDDADGIVVTQGTNCIEEVAYFVNLVVNTNKPIVFTGAEWRKKLTEIEIKQIVPTETLKTNLTPAITAALRTHYVENIFLPKLEKNTEES